MLFNVRQRHRRWLSDETGTVMKDWRGRVRIGLAFPNRYAVGMSNLGFQTVYAALNGFEGVVCERFFYPESEDLPAIRQNPGRLLSLESQRPARDFDLFVFSIAYENDYVNAIEMLKLAGFPVRREQRNREHPLLAAGGVAVFLNPEPLALFLDFFFIGEAEAILPDFLRVLKEKGESGCSRLEFLRELSENVAGIYVPAHYEPAYREDGTLEHISPLPGTGAPQRVVYRRADLDRAPPCRSVILTPNTEFSNTMLLEIGRGCGRGCRFCAAGFVYRPMRFHSAERLLRTLSAGGQRHPRIGLVSAAVSDHPEIGFLCRSLLEDGRSLSFSSLRADTLTPEIASALESSRHQAVAIAPEAGSERLRMVVNKNLDMTQILTAAERLTERGILHLKLYFMIGLPTESAEDLEAIVDTAKAIKHHVLKISRGRKRLGTITLSVHSFVPKPFTPFQWVAFAGVGELKNRAKWIRNALKKVPNVRVHFDLPKWAYVQALLARGDRRVGTLLEKVALRSNPWSKALREHVINPDFWVMRERGRDEVFPWEVIEHGVRRDYLWREYELALKGESTPECRPEEDCRRCGACTP